MPHVFADLVDQGVDFTRAYVNVSQCCPSRSTILTGLYSHDTGVDSNTDPLDTERPVRPTFVRALHDAGYVTMLDGKYLNSEGCRPQPGWDQWVCGTTQDELDPGLDVDGHFHRYRGPTSQILANFAVQFLGQHRDPRNPFFLYFAPRDPHMPANDPRGASIHVPFYDPPSYDQQPDPLSKPAWTRIPPLTPRELGGIQSRFQKMSSNIPPLDQDMGRILQALGNRARDTIVFFMSDNGFLYGEHRMSAKNQGYEESVRVPFVIRYPALLPPSQHFTSSALVGNMDLAATITDLAGIPWGADGISLVPLLAGQHQSVRSSLLLEWCEADPHPCPSTGPGVPPSFWGVETQGDVLLEYATGERELYDLRADPFETSNLAADPGHRDLVRQLDGELRRLRGPPSVPETTIAVGPRGAVAGAPLTFEFFSQARTTTFQCRLEGPGRPGTWGACPSGAITYQVLGRGTYTFEVRARDARGQLDPTPANRTFTVTR